MFSKENTLNEIRILKKELLTNYKKKYYSEAYYAELNLLVDIERIINNEVTHPYNQA